MMQVRADFWVDALIRRAESGLAAAYVIRRGDEHAGAVLVKVVQSRQVCRLYVPQRDEMGERIWVPHSREASGEDEIDAYCQRRVRSDPDLWIIEIEDRQGRHFLTEPVEEI